RQSLRVYLQAHGERRFGAEAGAHAAAFLACNRLVKLERAAPESLVAKSVEAEGVSTLLQHGKRIHGNRIIGRQLGAAPLSQRLAARVFAAAARGRDGDRSDDA